MPSLTVSDQMMPGSPNQTFPRITVGMNTTPCPTDITTAAAERPVA
jgi:hypothetical protein